MRTKNSNQTTSSSVSRREFIARAATCVATMAVLPSLAACGTVDSRDTAPAPASQGEFSVVPRGYEMGLIPVNDVSCSRCHSETGRRLGQIEFDIILYGEVWGEDQIFTWHLFKPHRYMFGTWDDEDGSRMVNPRMEAAGLLSYGEPDHGSKTWKPLPSAYDK